MKIMVAIIIVAVIAAALFPTTLSHLVVTASSVEALHHDLSSVVPPIENVGGLDPKIYTKEMSCLGYYGPLGPYGPLGRMGPIGSNLWNPSSWISALGDWSQWTDKHHGPLSVDGPLGHKGPLNPTAYWHDLPGINDFGKQLQVGGVWAVLGPCGPLGALGPLGPLGPVGAHGYATDRYGNYVSKGEIMRTVDIDWDGTGNNVRTYGLVENYRDLFAKTMDDNDASFMVHGSLRNTKATSTFTFTSPEDQFITIVVMPEKVSAFFAEVMIVLAEAAMANYESTNAPSAEKSFDDFDLDIYDGLSGKFVASSRSKTLVDFVTIQVKALTILQVKVSLKSSWHFDEKFYRLFVTGSTQYINKTDITGNHQLHW